MEIKTKYSIGNSLWFPRVFNDMNVDKIEVNGEIYTKSTLVLCASAFLMDIVSITIVVETDGEISTEYCFQEYNESSKGFHRYFIDEEHLKTAFDSEDGALEFAQNWKTNQNREYYGFNELEDL